MAFLETIGTNLEEWERAGATTALMEYMCELMEPTIHKTTVLERQLTTVLETNKIQRREMDELIRVKGIAEAQIEAVESFREELSRWDVQRRSAEAKVAEDLQLKTKEIDALRGSAEQQRHDVQGHDRSVIRIGEQLERSRKEMDEFRDFTGKRVDDLAKRLETRLDKGELRKVRIETDVSQLKDSKWGRETEEGKQTIKIEVLEKRIEEMVEELEKANRKFATKVQVEQIQTEVNEFLLEANEKVADLGSKLGGVVQDMKAHMSTAVDTVARATSQRTSLMESQLRNELAKMADIQEEVKTFIAKSEEDGRATEQRLVEVSDETRKRVEQLSAGVEEMKRTSRKNMRANEMAIAGLKQAIAKNSGPGGGGGMGGSGGGSTEAILGVLNILMESERLSCAMEEQDDTDRRKVSLVGLKDVKDQDSLNKARKTAKTANITSMDMRCISCSGDAPTLMAGFKMACLNYAPGSVSYQDTRYERSDIIRIRHHLIEQAFEQLTTLIAEEGGAGGASKRGSAQHDPGGASQLLAPLDPHVGLGSRNTIAAPLSARGAAPGDALEVLLTGSDTSFAEDTASSRATTLHGRSRKSTLRGAGRKAHLSRSVVAQSVD